MNEYFKKIVLSFVPDKESMQNVSTELGKNLEYAFKDSAIGKVLAQGFTSVLKGDNPLKAIFNTALKEFSNIVHDALDEMSDMLEYSQLSSARTRELAFGYGFSSSQAFGYERALQAVGLESMEDLMYANQQEQAQFREAFSKYTAKYDELYDSGFFEQLQEYQFEMQDFKFEMQQEVIEFFMNNKDTIMTTMRAVMKTSEFVLTALSKIIEFLDSGRIRSSSERSAAVSDIINSYSTSKSTNVKIDNTFNNVSKSDQSWLANAGTMTYEQVIKALE